MGRELGWEGVEIATLIRVMARAVFSGQAVHKVTWFLLFFTSLCDT